MKALIITEDTKVSDSLNLFLKKNSIDTIVYKWLLKALDNVEEIQPDLIIINTKEYPRLWKTMVQFVKSGIGGKNIKIFLYEPDVLNEEDQKKYDELGITGFFSDLNEISLNCIVPRNIKIQNLQNSLEQDFEKNAVKAELLSESESASTNVSVSDAKTTSDAESASANVSESDSTTASEPETTQNESKIDENSKVLENTSENFEDEIPTVSDLLRDYTGEILITDPETASIISGSFINKENNILECTIDFERNFKTNEKLSTVSTFIDNEIKDYSAVVKEYDSMTKKLVLQV